VIAIPLAIVIDVMEGVVIGVVHENGAVTEEDVVTAGRGAGRPFAGAGLIHQVVAGVGVVPHHGVGVSADHPVAHLLTGLGVVLSVGVAAAVPPEEGTIGTKATGTVVTIAVAIVACTAVVMGLDSVSTAPPLTRMTTVVSMVQQVEAMIHMDLLHPTVALVVTLSLTTARTAVAEVQDLMALLVVATLVHLQVLGAEVVAGEVGECAVMTAHQACRFLSGMYHQISHQMISRWLLGESER